MKNLRKRIKSNQYSLVTLSDPLLQLLINSENKLKWSKQKKL